MSAIRHPSATVRDLLADNLRRLRTARGWTQHQLARACGLPLSYVSQIEQARVNLTLASLEALALGLECWPADLLTVVHRPTAPEAARARGVPSA